MDQSIIKKIKEKREFSQLPEKDIKLAFSHFEKRQVSDEEKINLTKELLRKIFSAFISKKLLSLKNKEPEWILRKHISTRERLSHYEQIYKRIFGGYKEASVIDLGAGINGFSYLFFKSIGLKVKYVGIEAIGQLTDLMNFYFRKNKVYGEAIHMSLFEKERVKEEILKTKSPRIILLFKTIDALETLKRNYSKELIFELVPITDKIVISFATKSLGSRKKFKAKRNWVLDFIKENFIVLDDFEMGAEKYVVFNK